MDFTLQLLRMLAGLAVVLGLMGGLVYAAKRWGGFPSRTTSGTHIQVLERRYLGNKHSLVLVQIQEEYILLGISPERMDVLSRQIPISETGHDSSADVGKP